ncbi:hypothetical protein HNR73_004922 [Phytomonospora endophytica]|uniref:Uncharacterized protein n=1 Tax=Phytomonospora endophytica TaxID=714109 RepID=A0A841FX53_9ACTN|nr:hypothetical protein [Phytomonospora endophytica]
MITDAATASLTLPVVGNRGVWQPCRRRRTIVID